MKKPRVSTDVCLNEYDKTEWLDLIRKLKPGITEEEYDAMWRSFMEAKAGHERTKGLQ